MNRRLGTLALATGAMLFTAPPGVSQVVVEEIVCKDDKCEVHTGEDRLHVMMSQRGQNRVMLGIGIEPQQGADSNEYGVLVTSVTEDGPAEAAGLEAGDIITSLQGHRLTDPLPNEAGLDFEEELSLPVQRLQELMKEAKEGEGMELSYRRGGETATTSITPEMLDVPTVLSFGGEGRSWMTPDGGQVRIRRNGNPSVFEFRAPRMQSRGGVIELHGDEGDQDVRVLYRGDMDRLRAGDARTWSVAPRAGVMFRRDGKCGALGGLWMDSGLGCVDGARMITLNPELGEYFGVESGVLVTEVAEGSELGLRPGDVLLEIDGRNVRDPDHAARILGSYESDEAITMTVRRSNREITVEGNRG